MIVPFGDAACRDRLEIEAKLLANLYWNPIPTYNCMVDAGVCAGDAFSNPTYSDLFCVLASRAVEVEKHGEIDQGFDDRPSILACLERLGTVIGRTRLDEILDCEVCGAGGPAYSKLLAEYYRRHERIKEIAKEGDELAQPIPPSGVANGQI